MRDETIAERVRPLAAAFREAGLIRLAVRESTFELELRRTPRLAAEPARAAAAEREPRPTEAILADVVGVVRLVHPPVAEGQHVEAETDLAFVETLGIRTAVRPGAAGRVAAVYVSDGQPVEYGQPLFAIER